MLVVTHDRAFLDRFATDIIHVEDGAVRRYGNGYSGFLRARAAERQKLLAEHEAWQQDLARNKQLVVTNSSRLEAIPQKMEQASFGHGAFRARGRDHGAKGRVRMAKQRVTQLLAEPAIRPADPLQFTPQFSRSESSQIESGTQPEAATMSEDPDLLISAHQVSLGDEDNGPRLALDELAIAHGDRVLITGPNGAGKTTLLKVLAGELTPTQGTVERKEGLRLRWLRQELGRVDDRDRTLLQAFALATGEYADVAAEQLLMFGLFRNEDVDRPLTSLSVGMRRRFEVAVSLAAASDVLLLDEPTNHLAPELVEQLEDALESYEGAVVTVTHDRRWQQRAEVNSRMTHMWVRSGRAGVLGPAGETA